MADFRSFYPKSEQKPDYQKLYPTPGERAGMDARKPTRFSVPFVRLSFLLFLPLYLGIAAASVYLYASEQTRTALMINSFALIIATILIGILAIVMLGYARSLLLRNCAHPRLIELIYLGVVVPAGVLLLAQFNVWFAAATGWQMLGIEAGLIYAAALTLSVFARLIR